ncbi:MAG: LacI family DNA-binding transcriptional regulator [Rhodospirillaceae bacterium]|nr:LacI family DNA-binding transcriptional regulator [Rhodospirillaceae bacterium]
MLAAADRRRHTAPTIRDVAARAGVSPATVSNVLSGTRQVGEPLRRQVLEAIEAIGYRPNHLAASLRRQRTRTVGIVVPDITNVFFSALVDRLDGLAAADGYQILLVSSSEDPAREAARIQALLARRVDGLIIAPARDALPAVDDLPPTVVVDRALGLDRFDTIGADNEAAAHAGARHLLDLGHRDIALIATTGHLANIRDRIAGYRRALAEAGCAGRERLVFGGLTVEGSRAAIEREIARPDRPTALFAVTSVATLAAIQAIRALDLAFPGEVSLLGFDESDWMTALRPYVSTVCQPVETMAAEAWRRLAARLAGSQEAGARVRLPCTLRIRESTQPHRPRH